MAGQFLPSTRRGRIAAWLGVAFVAWFVVNQTLVVLRNQAGADGLPRAALIAYGLAGLAIGLAATIVALVAIRRDHERGVAAYLCLLPGGFVAVFLLGELLVPH